MAIDDDYDIDLDDGAHALVGHPDHDPSGPLDSDGSAFGLSEDHDGGGSGHGGSHHGRDSNSHDSHHGKRSHDSRDSHEAKRSHDGDDGEHSHKAKHSQKAKHSDDDSGRSDESARPKHDSRDSHEAKRSHDADDGDHSHKTKHSQKAKHSDDDSGRSDESARPKHDSRDSHEAKHSDDSRDTAHPDVDRPKDRHGSHSYETKDSHEIGISRQDDGTVYDTGIRTGAPRSPSADVADDLISAAYGTATGGRGAVTVHRPSFEQVDTSEPGTAPVHADPDLTPADASTVASPAAAGGTPAQVPLVADAPPPPAPAPVPAPPPVAAPAPPPYAPAPPRPAVPPSVEVVGTDMNGLPVIVRPVNTRMETFGGNNPNYVNGESVVHYVDDHIVSNVPINPPQTIVTFDGNLRTGPGGPIDRGPVTSNPGGNAPQGGGSEPLPPKRGYPTSDGLVFDTVGEQHRHEDALRQQQHPYESPTVKRGP
jgi:hypothetical protein